MRKATTRPVKSIWNLIHLTFGFLFVSSRIFTLAFIDSSVLQIIMQWSFSMNYRYYKIIYDVREALKNNGYFLEIFPKPMPPVPSVHWGIIYPYRRHNLPATLEIIVQNFPQIFQNLPKFSKFSQNFHWLRVYDIKHYLTPRHFFSQNFVTLIADVGP